MRKPVIAIDGYSSTGKSSISKIIAQRLGLLHLDTGALYRGITLFALQNFRQADGTINLEMLILNLDRVSLTLKRDGSELILYLNHKDITTEIRNTEVSDHVSYVAKEPRIREYLLKIQRDIAQNGGVILDGRDIGTVVLPDADYKFFITASPEERARRRFLELKDAGQSTDTETVKQNLIMRDKIDSERETAPLKKAEDAMLIDNTNMDKQQTLELILSKIHPF